LRLWLGLLLNLLRFDLCRLHLYFLGGLHDRCLRRFCGRFRRGLRDIHRKLWHGLKGRLRGDLLSGPLVSFISAAGEKVQNAAAEKVQNGFECAAGNVDHLFKKTLFLFGLIPFYHMDAGAALV
jgi:hypothetical protein